MVTGPNTPLQYSKSTKDSVSRAVDLWLAGGAPASKLILGMAAYGHTWTLASTSSFGKCTCTPPPLTAAQ